MTDIKEKRVQPFAGYHRTATAAPDAELTLVGPGTPCGEYMRRFWQPFAMTAEIAELPRVVKVLGEELVLFRDLSGRIGLLHKHCVHRHTSLEYGILAENGIRCCYHGWLFDIDGQILETPGEPATSRIKHNTCQGAYPTREYKGLIFTYMGPPESMPEFPIFDTLELPGNDLVPYALDYPCNWLQVAENPMDPFHSVFLHTRATRAHFNPAWGAMPEVEWIPMASKAGIYLTNTRRWQQYLWVRTAEVILPNFAQPPDIYQNPDREKFFPRVGITKWTVPTADAACRIVGWRHFNETLDLDGKGNRDHVGLNKIDFVGQTGVERSYEEGQRMPSDYEAQIGQGPITVHALETLGKTDTGVAMYRRMLRRGIRAVAAGEELPKPEKNEAGQIATMAGDVILAYPTSNTDDAAVQRDMGHKIGEIVAQSLKTPHGARQKEIECRVLALRQ